MTLFLQAIYFRYLISYFWQFNSFKLKFNLFKQWVYKSLWSSSWSNKLDYRCCKQNAQIYLVMKSERKILSKIKVKGQGWDKYVRFYNAESDSRIRLRSYKNFFSSWISIYLRNNSLFLFAIPKLIHKSTICSEPLNHPSSAWNLLKFFRSRLVKLVFLIDNSLIWFSQIKIFASTLCILDSITTHIHFLRPNDLIPNFLIISLFPRPTYSKHTIQSY